MIDLQIAPGKVTALVQGSSLYEVAVTIEAVSPPRWKALVHACAGGIDSMIELLQGKLSTAVMATMTHPETGLFPAPARIAMKCSCPDWATMCKHVAAVLYGIGARLDRAPELLFRLRGADPGDLVATAARAGISARTPGGAARTLGDADLASVFGIELAGPPVAAPAIRAASSTSPAARAAAKAAVKAGGGTAKREVMAARRDVATAQLDASPRGRRKAPSGGRVASSTIARAELLRLGLTPGTVRNWMKHGLLEPTPLRGVYATTREARRLLGSYRRHA